MSQPRDLNHTEGFMNPMMYEDEFNKFTSTLDALPDGMKLMEFGSGGSTYQIGLRLKPQQELFSVEHNPEWFAKVREAVKTLDVSVFQRIHRTLAIPKFTLQTDNFARPFEEVPAGLTTYLHPTFKVPLDWKDVGFVFVDGLARGATLAVLNNKLAPGTTVFLHDYIGREEWYQWAVDLYERVSLTNMLLELKVKVW